MKYEKPEVLTFTKEDLEILQLSCKTCCCVDMGGVFN